MILYISAGYEKWSNTCKNRYVVYCVDFCSKFCDNAKKLGIDNVYNIRIQDINFNNKFNGIWACASLLHIESNELSDVFNKCADALKENGIIYASFKYGNFKGIRVSRYYLDLNEDVIKKYITSVNLSLIEFKISNDIRCNNTKWLNVILKKKLNSLKFWVNILLILRSFFYLKT